MCPPATRGNFAHNFFGFGFGMRVVHDDIGAVRSQAKGDAAADALGRAGHEGDFSFERLTGHQRLQQRGRCNHSIRAASVNLEPAEAL